MSVCFLSISWTCQVISITKETFTQQPDQATAGKPASQTPQISGTSSFEKHTKKINKKRLKISMSRTFPFPLRIWSVWSHKSKKTDLDLHSPGGMDAARRSRCKQWKHRGLRSVPQSCVRNQSFFNSAVSSGNVTQDGVCSFSAFLRLLNRHDSQMAI